MEHLYMLVGFKNNISRLHIRPGGEAARVLRECLSDLPRGSQLPGIADDA